MSIVLRRLAPVTTVSRSLILRSFSASPTSSSTTSSGGKTLYTAQAHTTGGRNGNSSSDDGKLKVILSSPKSMGGDGNGTNPEQLFASGYSACFLGAMGLAARNNKQTLSKDSSIDAKVFLNQDSGGKLNLAVEFVINIPGMNKSDAEKLVAAAHQICPYSRGIKGNVPVTLTVKA